MANPVTKENVGEIYNLIFERLIVYLEVDLWPGLEYIFRGEDWAKGATRFQTHSSILIINWKGHVLI
jgi:hypothetical protein